MDFVFMFLGWILPLAAIIFVVSAMWQTLKGIGEINSKLDEMIRLLRERP